MNLFEKTTTWSNTELYIFKICVFSCGIIAGYILRDYLEVFLPYIIALAVVTVLWTGYLWIRKMKSNNK